METKEIFDQMNQDMRKSIDHANHEFSSLHTGKANSTLEGYLPLATSSTGTITFLE